MAVLFRTAVTLAIILRGALVIYGVYQDGHSTLKYTDIDYKVFSDAARIMLKPAPEQHAKGWLVEWLDLGIGDPYERETYRYTPLLAAALMNNEYIHHTFGKIIFAAADILVGILLYSLPRNAAEAAPPLSDSALYWVSCIWLLNPMPANISTRGSSESVLGLMVISTLVLVMRKRYDCAAVMFGLSVHFKVYPFIYGASILAFMGPAHRPLNLPTPIAFISRSITIERLRFTLVSFATFALLNIVMYFIWGYPFLHHTYIYHITRKDHRHNFSPYFYPIYLGYIRAQDTLLPTLAATSFVGKLLRSPLVSFVPQMLLAIGSGFALGTKREDLPFAWFVQTAVFVTFNKVCTSQYFMWYLWFLPLVLPRLALSPKRAALLLSLWVGAQALWLSIAYRLEFLGEPRYVELWGAGIVFLALNSFLIGELVLAHR